MSLQKPKVYLSISNACTTSQSQRVKSVLRMYDVEVVVPNGDYNSKMLMDCSYLLVLPPYFETHLKEFTIGRGQSEQIKTFLTKHPTEDIFFIDSIKEDRLYVKQPSTITLTNKNWTTNYSSVTFKGNASEFHLKQFNKVCADKEIEDFFSLDAIFDTGLPVVDSQNWPQYAQTILDSSQYSPIESKPLTKETKVIPMLACITLF